MKIQEKRVLFKEKIREGKSEKIANQEIKRDEEYCKKSKIINKNLVKNIKLMKNKKDKQFKEAFNKLTHPKNEYDNRHIKLYINRVLNRLKESPTTQNQLTDDCCMSNERVVQILSLLLKLNKIKILEAKERGTIYASC